MEWHQQLPRAEADVLVQQQDDDVQGHEEDADQGHELVQVEDVEALDLGFEQPRSDPNAQSQ